jgi:mRNA-degrading endonuclease RelE of RelBE toxin-antitoxin system
VGKQRPNRREPSFKKQFDKLPAAIQTLARAAFETFKKDPFAPCLHNHPIDDSKKGRHKKGTRSVRVNYRYRALYVEMDDVNLWYWIGSHEDYNDFLGKT